MENARLLDERLRKIIREISGRTGEEMKRNLIDEFAAGLKSDLAKYNTENTIRMLSLMREALNKSN